MALPLLLAAALAAKNDGGGEGGGWAEMSAEDFQGAPMPWQDSTAGLEQEVEKLQQQQQSDPLQMAALRAQQGEFGAYPQQPIPQPPQPMQQPMQQQPMQQQYDPQMLRALQYGGY